MRVVKQNINSSKIIFDFLIAEEGKGAQGNGTYTPEMQKRLAAIKVIFDETNPTLNQEIEDIFLTKDPGRTSFVAGIKNSTIRECVEDVSTDEVSSFL